jgi:hypothetical protein
LLGRWYNQEFITLTSVQEASAPAGPSMSRTAAMGLANGAILHTRSNRSRRVSLQIVLWARFRTDFSSQTGRFRRSINISPQIAEQTMTENAPPSGVTELRNQSPDSSARSPFFHRRAALAWKDDYPVRVAVVARHEPDVVLDTPVTGHQRLFSNSTARRARIIGPGLSGRRTIVSRRNEGPPGGIDPENLHSIMCCN